MLLFKCFKHKFQAYIEKSWYERSLLGFFLWPFAKTYQLISFLRRIYLQKFKQHNFSVPIIVIGNISVGGVGKTPLVIAIAEKFTARGFAVGIVSRGYGAVTNSFPHLVNISDKAKFVGDEPLLLAIRTKCPVVIDPNRVRAVQYLLDNFAPDIILSDDGLQHYALARDIEIAVLDGERALGNGLHLPAGPLRESSKRLAQVDFVVSNSAIPIQTGSGAEQSIFPLRGMQFYFRRNENNGYFASVVKLHPMQIEPLELRSCVTQHKVGIESLDENLIAIAAIGNPHRFFQTLQGLDLKSQNYSFPDHYQYTVKDFANMHASVVMTEKDFVKCKEFANDAMYYLPIVAKLTETFWDSLFEHPKISKLDIP